MRRPLVLTTYAISRPYRKRLEEQLGEQPSYLTVGELRRLSAARLARLAWRHAFSPVLIPWEDASTKPVARILSIVSLVFLPRRVTVVGPDLRGERLRLLRIVFTTATVTTASVRAQQALRRARGELERLAVEPRIEVPRGEAKCVLYVNGNLWFGLKVGGSVGHVAGVANGFARTGYRVSMISAAEPVTVDAAVRHEQLQPPAFGVPVEASYYRFNEQIAEAATTAARNGELPSFLYQRLSVANYSGVLASRALRIPLVLEYNGSETWAARHWGRPLRYEDTAMAAEEVSLRHAHLVVCVSEVLRRELLSRGVESDRIVMYPNCVDPQRFDPDRLEGDRVALRAELGIDDEDVVVGFVGTFGQWHGAEVLARAARLLVEADGDDRIRFLFVGDGLRMHDVRSELGAAHARTTLTGLVPQDEAPRYLAACDVLSSPHVANLDGSEFFGSPTKLFEYMAMRRPIVASRLAQIGDVLQPSVRADALDVEVPGAVAVTTEPGSAEEIVQAIRWLAASPGTRAALGRNARAEVLAHYTWGHHVAAILQALEQLDRAR